MNLPADLPADLELPDDPVYHIRPVDVFKLRANSWNPNTVFNTELRLLEQSIVENGWLHPIIANLNYVIVDGYHRHWLAKNSQTLMERDAGIVPVVFVDIPDSEAMMMTVRMNRAKGTHGALAMRDLVQTLIDDHDVDAATMIEKMGMTESEVGLLYDGSLLKESTLRARSFSKAWVPIETRSKKREPTADQFEREEGDG